MPYKDRARYLAYMRAYHARTRPSPAPIPQPRGHLPPLGVLLADDDGSRVQCHVCGGWYGWLVSHVWGVHHLRADAYKERYGLARGLALASPQHRARQRAAALARGQGDLGRAYLEPGGAGRPTGLDNRLSSRIVESQTHTRC